MTLAVLILVPTYLLMAVFYNLTAKPHNHVILENTLPKDKLNDPQVLAVFQAFRKRTWLLAGASGLLTALTALIPYDSLFFTFFLLLLLGNMLLNYLCKVHYIRQMRLVIIKNAWQLPSEPLLVDTKTILQKNQQLLPLRWLLGSLVFTLVLTGASFWLTPETELSLFFGLTTLFLWGSFAFSYYIISRFPVKAYTDDPAFNQQYNDLTKYYWSLAIVVMSYLFAPMALAPKLLITVSSSFSLIFNIGFMLLMIFGCFFAIRCLFVLRKKQDQLIAHASRQRYTGEDQFWRYGFYYNPDDRRLMLPDRIGMNITTNFARPAAKIIAVLTGIFIIGVFAVVTIPLYYYDFNREAFQVEISQTHVTLEAPFTKESKIKLAAIEKIELLDSLPKDTLRTNGLGTEHYAVGAFKAAGKSATFYVNLQKMPVLRITTAQRDYYITSNIAGEAASNYKLLESALN